MGRGAVLSSQITVQDRGGVRQRDERARLEWAGQRDCDGLVAGASARCLLGLAEVAPGRAWKGWRCWYWRGRCAGAGGNVGLRVGGCGPGEPWDARGAGDRYGDGTDKCDRPSRERGCGWRQAATLTFDDRHSKEEVRRSKLYRGGQAVSGGRRRMPQRSVVVVMASGVEDGHGGAGEEGELEGVAGDVGGHPLGVVGGAKGSCCGGNFWAPGTWMRLQGAGCGRRDLTDLLTSWIVRI